MFRCCWSNGLSVWPNGWLFVYKVSVLGWNPVAVAGHVSLPCRSVFLIQTLKTIPRSLRLMLLFVGIISSNFVKAFQTESIGEVMVFTHPLNCPSVFPTWQRMEILLRCCWCFAALLLRKTHLCLSNYFLFRNNMLNILLKCYQLPWNIPHSHLLKCNINLSTVA